MPIINLKEHYPTAHPKDFFVEVSDEVHQFLLSMKRKEDAFARQVSRYHAYHSLDDPAFSAESYLLVPTPTPAEIIERQQHLVNINHTILALSPKQAKRCYDYFYCGISMPSIAEKEGTTVGSVSGSIKSALISDRHLGKIERGEGTASIDLLVEVAISLNTTLDFLILGVLDTPRERELNAQIKKQHQKIQIIKNKLSNLIDELDASV